MAYLRYGVLVRAFLSQKYCFLRPAITEPKVNDIERFKVCTQLTLLDPHQTIL